MRSNGNIWQKRPAVGLLGGPHDPMAERIEFTGTSCTSLALADPPHAGEGEKDREWD